MKYNIALFLLFFIVYTKSITGQDCQYSGGVCADHKDCCGGCCLNNVCTDATLHCWDYDHLCLLHPCIGETECKVYQAWDGSEPQVYCE